MKLLHTTSPESAEAILQSGFKAPGGERRVREFSENVWLSADHPHEGRTGDALLELEMPAVVVEPYEQPYSGLNYRVFLVPPAVVNRYEVRLVSDAERDERFEPTEQWFQDHAGWSCFVRRYADGRCTGHTWRQRVATAPDEVLDDDSPDIEGQSITDVQRLVQETIQKAGHICSKKCDSEWRRQW